MCWLVNSFLYAAVLLSEATRCRDTRVENAWLVIVVPSKLVRSPIQQPNPPKSSERTGIPLPSRANEVKILYQR